MQRAKWKALIQTDITRCFVQRTLHWQEPPETGAFDWVCTPTLLKIRQSIVQLRCGSSISSSNAIQDSAWNWIQNLCQWDLVSRFQSFVGFRIHWAVCPDSWFYKKKISRIPESQFPYMRRQIILTVIPQSYDLLRLGGVYPPEFSLTLKGPVAFRRIRKFYCPRLLHRFTTLTSLSTDSSVSLIKFLSITSDLNLAYASSFPCQFYGFISWHKEAISRRCFVAVFSSWGVSWRLKKTGLIRLFLPVGFEPTIPGLDLLLLYQLSYEAWRKQIVAGFVIL